MSSTETDHSVSATDAAAQLDYNVSIINEVLRRMVDTIANTMPNCSTATITDAAYNGYATPMVDQGGGSLGARRFVQIPPTLSNNRFRPYHRGEMTKKEKAYYGSEEVVCPVCAKTLTASNIRHHMNTHLIYTQRPYPCEYCDKCFAYKKNFDRHMLQQHPENFLSSS